MRWVRRIAVGLIVLVAVAAVMIYGGSAWIVGRSYAVPLPRIAADRTPAGIAEGARVAAMIGCRGCHNRDGHGRLLSDAPGVIHVAAPALAPIVARYSDAELARLIRYGVKRDGRGVFIMPVNGHNHIADDDIARVLGWLRTLKPSSADRQDTLRFGPVGRVAILAGGIAPEVRMTSDAPRKRPTDLGPYLAAAVCGGCHSLHEQRKAHDDGRPVPALAEIVPAYDLPAFKTLLRTGVGLTPRDLGLMGRVGKGDLSRLDDAEIKALHGFLTKEASNNPAR